MRRNSMRIAQEMKFWPRPVPELALHMCVLCSSWPLGKPEGLLCYLQQLVGTFYPRLRTVPTSLQFQASPYFRLLLPLALVLMFVLGFPAFCSQGLGFGLTPTTNTRIHTHTHHTHTLPPRNLCLHFPPSWSCPSIDPLSGCPELGTEEETLSSEVIVLIWGHIHYY